MIGIVRISVLGPLVVEVDGCSRHPRPLEARLLLALVWARGIYVNNDLLGERVYFDRQARELSSWRFLLRQSLGNASTIVESVRGRGTRLVLDGSTGVEVQIDLVDFENLLARGENALRGGDNALARRLVDDAPRAASPSTTELWRRS